MLDSLPPVTFVERGSSLLVWGERFDAGATLAGQDAAVASIAGWVRGQLAKS